MKTSSQPQKSRARPRRNGCRPREATAAAVLRRLRSVRRGRDTGSVEWEVLKARLRRVIATEAVQRLPGEKYVVRWPRPAAPTFEQRQELWEFFKPHPVLVLSPSVDLARSAGCVRVGDFALTELSNGKLWLQLLGGEGMECRPADLERVLQRFLRQRF